MEPLVSIIVPVYNVELYIEKCIKSLINQSYKNIEIILIDDGSLDRSGEICDEYQIIDPRIKVYHKVNGGLSDARNYGLDHIRGEYVFFIDSDDWIELDSIKKLIDFTIMNNVDIVCYGINDYVGDSILSRRGALDCKILNGKEASHLLVEKGDEVGIVVWNKLYKTQLFENIRFEKGKINEDVFFTPKIIYSAAKVGIINYYGYNYVKNRTDSICNKSLSVKNIDAVDAFYSNSAFFEGKDEYLFQVYKIKAAHIMLDLYCNAKNENNKELCNVILKRYKKNAYSTLKICLRINNKEFVKNIIFCFSKRLYFKCWLNKKMGGD